MKTKKTELPELTINYDLPTWLGVNEMMTLLDCKDTKAYDEINLIIELIKDKYPQIYNSKSKVKKSILTYHFIKYNDVPYSREDVLQSLKNGISLQNNAIRNIDSPHFPTNPNTQNYPT
jgi:alpha-N-acetylglucosamine transferase